MYPGLLFFPPYHYKSVQCRGMTWIPASTQFFAQEEDEKFSVVFDSHSFTAFLQINTAQLCLWHTEEKIAQIRKEK